MAHPETVPPTRAVGDGNPPVDINALSTAVTNIDNRLYSVEGGNTAIRNVSSATITPQASDLANVVRSTYSGLVTVTVPSDTTLTGWAVGQWTDYIQDGNGPLSFVAGSGVSAINSLTVLKRTAGIGARVRLQKVAANTFELTGDLAAPQDTFPSRLKTSGRNLVDANGFVMPKLKGFNVQPAAWSQQNYNDMAAVGAKIQRLIVFWDSIEPTTQGVIDSSWVTTWLDPCVARAEVAGMYTLFSIHLNVGRIPGWVNALLPSASNGEDVQYSTYGQTMTQYLANRYGNPSGAKYTKSCIGIGINELPVGDSTIRNGNGMNPYIEGIQSTMLNWVRNSSYGNAPDWIGFVCTAYGNATPTYDTYSTSGNTGATWASHTAYDAVGGNVVLDVHDYAAGTTSSVSNDDGRLFNGIVYPTYQGGPSIGSDTAGYEYTSTATAQGQLSAFIDPFKRFSIAGQIPLMLGEWGYANGKTVTSEEAWIGDQIAVWNDAGTCIELQWNYDINVNNTTWAARPVGYAFRPSIQIWMGQTWAQNASRKNESYSVQTGFATDTYLAGSNLAMPANLPQASTRYRLTFSMTKTAAGTAAPVLTVRIGTPSSATVTNKALTSNVATLTTSAAHGFSTGQTVNVGISDTVFDGTYTITSVPLSTTFTYAKTNANVTSAAATGTATRPAGTLVDPAILTFTFGAGTAAADTGTFIVDCIFRTVGSGTSAVVSGIASLINNLQTTGLSSTIKALQVVSSGFNSTSTNQVIGASFNGGTSFSGTCQLVDAELLP